MKIIHVNMHQFKQPVLTWEGFPKKVQISKPGFSFLNIVCSVHKVTISTGVSCINTTPLKKWIPITGHYMYRLHFKEQPRTVPLPQVNLGETLNLRLFSVCF